MTSIVRRLDRLEGSSRHRDRFANHPARIPDWIRPWLDPLTIEELEVLETCMAHRATGDDLITLPVEIREEYERLQRSWAAFCEGVS